MNIVPKLGPMLKQLKVKSGLEIPANATYHIAALKVVEEL